MERSDQHDGESDGEHESQHRSRDRGTRSTSKEAKLVPVKSTGLSGPFIRRPVMTVLLTLSVIVAGIATYNSLAVNDVQAAIQRATGKLPIDLPSPPTFSKTNPNDQAVYLLGLLSDTMTDGDLYKY